MAVKEQRVDGSYCINSAQRLQSNLGARQLRCTLMGFERNYQFKIPSNQLNKALFSTSIQDPKLNPWFVSGLVEAVGTFSVSILGIRTRLVSGRSAPLRGFSHMDTK